MKKTIRKLVAKPGLRRLKPVSDGIMRRAGLREEAAQLRNCGVPVILFGINRLSLKFYKLLQANAVETKLVAMDEDAIPESCQKDVIQAEDLLYLKEQNPKFYSMTASRDGVVKSRLLDLGFRPQSVKRLGYGTLARVRGCRLADAWDPLLGSVRSKDSEVPGYTVFSNCKSADCLRIMILGGSTSDPTLMNLKSWSEYLFEALRDMSIPVTIYNGAVGGYCAAQEMKKLMRDLPVLRQHLVFSPSGVNDAAGIYMNAKHPLYQQEDEAAAQWLVRSGRAVNQLQDGIPLKNTSFGPKDGRTLFEVWLDMERSMHGICSEFDAQFYAFLQPIREISAVKTYFYREAKQKLARNKPDWMQDLTGFYEKDKAVFSDFCHVYERGNRKMSRYMLRYVLEYLSSGGCE
ncbi:MAG: hypothetical protein MJ135_05970 [Oscillospiraceae bacterium]|nr:hypothetical protein [Oscillospiraceae bacterium]